MHELTKETPFGCLITLGPSISPCPHVYDLLIGLKNKVASHILPSSCIHSGNFFKASSVSLKMGNTSHQPMSYERERTHLSHGCIEFSSIEVLPQALLDLGLIIFDEIG